MSNYCDGCRYDPDRRTGARTCPFNLLYWDFLYRHRRVLAANPRMGPVLASLGKLDPQELEAVRHGARAVLDTRATPAPAGNRSPVAASER